MTPPERMYETSYVTPSSMTSRRSAGSDREIMSYCTAHEKAARTLVTDGGGVPLSGRGETPAQTVIEGRAHEKTASKCSGLTDGPGQGAAKQPSPKQH